MTLTKEEQAVLAKMKRDIEDQERNPRPKATRMPDGKLEHPFGHTDERSEDDIFFTEMEIELLLGGLQAQNLPDELTIEERNWAAPAIIKFLLQSGGYTAGITALEPVPSHENNWCYDPQTREFRGYFLDTKRTDLQRFEYSLKRKTRGKYKGEWKRTFWPAVE